jgi:hypothetical protein
MTCRACEETRRVVGEIWRAITREHEETRRRIQRGRELSATEDRVMYNALRRTTTNKEK